VSRVPAVTRALLRPCPCPCGASARSPATPGTGLQGSSLAPEVEQNPGLNVPLLPGRGVLCRRDERPTSPAPSAAFCTMRTKGRTPKALTKRRTRATSARPAGSMMRATWTPPETSGQPGVERQGWAPFHPVLRDRRASMARQIQLDPATRSLSSDPARKARSCEPSDFLTGHPLPGRESRSWWSPRAHRPCGLNPSCGSLVRCSMGRYRKTGLSRDNHRPE
jgi:hypothetical protein